MNLSPRAATPLLCCLYVGGCTIQSTCDLYNNTGLPLEIIQRSNDARDLTLVLQPNSSVRLDSWLLFEYQVVSENKAWSYTPTDPTSDFIAFEGLGPWAKRIFRAQLEADGRIYALETTQQAPARTFPKQPEGFPLVPR